MTTDIMLVWAQDRAGAIGRANAIPWHVPEDMAHFREVTAGHPVLMGRRTWESLPPRFRPLPGRRNVVITRSPTFVADGAEVTHSLAEATDLVTGTAVVIGGGEIYAAAMEFATRLCITEIDQLVDGADAFAPAIDPDVWQVDTATQWQESRTGTRYRFVDHVRHVPSAG